MTAGDRHDHGRGTHVLNSLRRRLTYANVMSTLAVFIALGGSSYAAFTINGASIKNRSIAGKKLRHNTLTGAQIKESRLGTRAARATPADTLDGITRRGPEDQVPERHVPDRRRLRRADAARRRVVRQRGADVPRRRDARRPRTAAADARRAPRGADGASSSRRAAS